MEQKANITIDNHHITVERTQTACGLEIRVISVFPNAEKPGASAYLTQMQIQT